MGGDLQVTPHKDYAGSHYPPLADSVKTHASITSPPMYIYTFTPAKIHLDHRLLRQTHTPQHYMIHDTKITTFTPEYGDHKDLFLDLPQIGDTQQHKAKCNHSNPTTRSHPTFILPIPHHLAKLYRLGNTSTKANAQRTTHTTTALLHDNTAIPDHIDYEATQVMTIINEYHDIATTIWPIQPPRHDTTTPTQLEPPISRAGLRQIDRLAKLRNECNKTTKLHLEKANNADLNSLHIYLKISHILSPTTPLTTTKANSKWSRAIGSKIRKAINTLSDKYRDKENSGYDKSPKHYHDSLKIHSGLTPRARGQPRGASLTNPKKPPERSHGYSHLTIRTKRNNKGQH